MKLAIYGYGNLGKGVEAAISKCDDAELFCIFTRRNPESINAASGAPVFSADEILLHKDEIDVLLLCGGSKDDLPSQSPELASHFNIIDSFDTHANIPSHFANVDKAAKAGDKTALISCGWDPGLFSVNRLIADSILPGGKTYTFWGKGVSQGHSDAIRRISGVVDARQYTIPIEDSLNAVRAGEQPKLSTREKHSRLCYVVAAEDADKAAIEKQIKEMPNYFADYDTTVKFISAEEMATNHSKLPHGGHVIHSAKTGLNNENIETIEYSLSLESNPEFTASVIVAYARALFKMHLRGERGCKTVFDVAPADLTSLGFEDMLSML